MATQYVLVDTTVISHLTKASKNSEMYNGMLRDWRMAASFQTPPELKGANFGSRRQQRLEDLLAVTLKLPHSEATDVWYARVAEKRKELRRRQFSGSDASDADMWIISNALEHRLPLLSHDEQQVSLGRAMGLRVLTNLPGLGDQNPSI